MIFLELGTNVTILSLRHTIFLGSAWNRTEFQNMATSWVLGSKFFHSGYGVAKISRMLKNTGFFCTRALQKRPVFCKETCSFKHPTSYS